MLDHVDNVGMANLPGQALGLSYQGHVRHVLQVTTMLSHVEEVGKAPLPDQAELDTLRSNVGKQQEKVDQLSTPHSSANGTEVCLSLHCHGHTILLQQNGSSTQKLYILAHEVIVPYVSARTGGDILSSLGQLL